jgi:hypothetical protein
MIPIPLNFRGITAVSIVLIVWMLVFIRRETKHKSDYDKATGRITYLEKKLGEFPLRNLEKYRYMKVSGYEYPFEIFIGNEFGDFKPKFQQIDKLKPGDTITVYFYTTDDTRKDGLNRFIQYIEMKENSFFERGDSGKLSGIVVIFICVLLLASGFILWKLGKISF